MALRRAIARTQPAGLNFLQQQARFDDLVDTYNTERPHQALVMQSPSQLYRDSARAYAGLPELHDKTIIVTTCGRICFSRQKINVSQDFAGQKVGIKQVDKRIWLATFMHCDLG